MNFDSLHTTLLALLALVNVLAIIADTNKNVMNMQELLLLFSIQLLKVSRHADASRLAFLTPIP